MKKILLVIFSLLPLSAFAQTLSYSYDAMGNRIAREIVISKSAAPKKDTTSYVSEVLSERTVKIYPNQ